MRESVRALTQLQWSNTTVTARPKKPENIQVCCIRCFKTLHKRVALLCGIEDVTCGNGWHWPWTVNECSTSLDFNPWQQRFCFSFLLQEDWDIYVHRLCYIFQWALSQHLWKQVIVSKSCCTSDTLCCERGAYVDGSNEGIPPGWTKDILQRHRYTGIPQLYII